MADCQLCGSVNLESAEEVFTVVSKECGDQIARIPEGPWGQEPASSWGTMNVDVDGGMVIRPVTPVPGDYRIYYAGIRDALLGKAPDPVAAIDAWRTSRLLEWAAESAVQRREIACDWSGEPA